MVHFHDFIHHDASEDWHISPSLTTQHLLAVIAVANTLLMSMNNAGFFLPGQEKKRKLMKSVSRHFLLDLLFGIMLLLDGCEARTICRRLSSTAALIIQ